jgi:hypothetical protein
VPRYRDRRGKVDVIEPAALDLSAFDVELDPKRVPTFGSIVEGKGRPKRGRRGARRRRRRLPATAPSGQRLGSGSRRRHRRPTTPRTRSATGSVPPPAGSPPMSKTPKVTTHTLREMKAQRQRIAALTAYDHLFAGLLDAGRRRRAAGRRFGGHRHAGPRHHRAGDDGPDGLPLPTRRSRAASARWWSATCRSSATRSSVEDALRNAGRLLKEGLAEAVKLEGGAHVRARPSPAWSPPASR